MKPRRERDSKGRVKTSGVGQICGTYTTYLRRKAKERDLCWEVSEEYLWDLATSQDLKCAISGIDIMFSTKINKHNNIDRTKHTASLDRIDSSIGYIEGNLQWTHKAVNIMKQSLSYSEFLIWCRLIVNHANPEPSVGNDIKEVPTKVQRLGGEDNQTNNPPTSAQHPKTEQGDYIYSCTKCNRFLCDCSDEDIV